MPYSLVHGLLISVDFLERRGGKKESRGRIFFFKKKREVIG
jgi:hypothetical protein